MAHPRRTVRRHAASLALVGAACLGLAAQAQGVPGVQIDVVDPKSRSIGLASTYSHPSFRVTNLSTAGETIEQISIEGPFLFPRLVFDPIIGPPAGDSARKDLEVSDGSATAQFLDVVDQGFNRMVLSTDFGGDDDLQFSIDVDPTSIQGSSGSGSPYPAPPASHVSGAELHGGKVTVTFNGGVQRTTDFSLVPGQAAGQERESRAVISPSGALPEPAIARAGGYPTLSTTPGAVQPIVVTGPPGSGELVVADGHLNLQEADGSPVPGRTSPLEPYEANTVVKFSRVPFTIPSGATATTVDVTLTRAADADHPFWSPDRAGLNYITAHYVSGQTPGPVSPPIVLEYDPSAPAEPVPPSPGPGPGGGGSGTPATPIPPAAAPSPSPICAAGFPVARGSGGSGARVTLTDRQLLINQRISQAAVRRLNGLQRWLDARVAARDICGGAIGADRLSAGLGLGVGAQVAGVRANPRGVVVRKRSGRGDRVTVTVQQLRINDRIARAALQRAQAIERRLDAGLTGGDLRPGAVGPAQLAPGLVVTSAPVGVTSAARTRTVPKGSINSGVVRFEASQLLRTQRISQQAVRITNRLTSRLSRGLTAGDFRPGSIGPPGLSG